jgi:hypothetical protein
MLKAKNAAIERRRTALVKALEAAKGNTARANNALSIDATL